MKESTPTTPTRDSAGRVRVAVAATLLVASLAQPYALAQDRELEQRMMRLERLLDSSGIMQLLDSVDALKNEVRQLRGEIEVQAHAIGQLKERQRQLYEDVDNRLKGMEAAARAPAAPSARNDSSGAEAGDPALETPSSGTPVTADAAKEQSAYQAAFNMLKAGRYDAAAEAFKAFLSNYPGGKYSDNAQYWLGETYYVTRRFEPAMQEFQTLLRKHPDSQKRTHALLKVGYIHDELGQTELARRVLEDLVRSDPDSTAAGLARKRLERLRGR